MSEHTDHAVVVGASMGGLVAARALSEAYAHVTVVERDPLPDVGLPGGATARRGVPQGRHAHGLLARGREALEELFPGLTDELIGYGVPPTDLQSGFRWINGGRLLCQAPSGLTALGVSRPLLESALRARVRALPNVTVADSCDAAGLTASGDGRRVTGLRVLRRGDSRTEEIVAADLVVDATGRGSRGPQWLAALGYPAPATERVEVGLTYASRSYRRAEDAPQGVAIAGTLANPRGGVAIPQEGDRWIVSIGGMLGDAAPLDHDGYTAFASTLPSPAIHELIRDAEPLSDPLRFRYLASTRRRYERLHRFPEGYLVFGDAISSFNPVYGQGMTVAALEALLLRECLREGTGGLAGRFLGSAARIVDIPWDISVGADLRFPGVAGRRTAKVRTVNAYLERLHRAAEHDPVVGRAFLRVVNLLDRPERLMAPGIAWRVLAARPSTAPTAAVAPVRVVVGAGAAAD
ncbi:FAD-dependent oxidoreductase [Blastococcus deserti]|uniref:FAD-dependent oxidoreductase n=1 Tax=Blastococcus deserti TaxID=2259033 RepID=A0ABW4XD81_9ACTN